MVNQDHGRGGGQGVCGRSQYSYARVEHKTSECQLAVQHRYQSGKWGSTCKFYFLKFKKVNFHFKKLISRLLIINNFQANWLFN